MMSKERSDSQWWIIIWVRRRQNVGMMGRQGSGACGLICCFCKWICKEFIRILFIILIIKILHWFIPPFRLKIRFLFHLSFHQLGWYAVLAGEFYYDRV